MAGGGGVGGVNTMWSPKAIKVNKETSGFFTWSIKLSKLGPDSAMGINSFTTFSSQSIPGEQMLAGVMSVFMRLAELGLWEHRDGDDFSPRVCGSLHLLDNLQQCHQGWKSGHQTAQTWSCFEAGKLRMHMERQEEDRSFRGWMLKGISAHRLLALVKASGRFCTFEESGRQV